jgi:ATP-dependent Lon protease
MAVTPAPSRTYPSDLPVVALRQTVVFPLTLAPLAINRPSSIDAVQRALTSDRLLFLTLQHSDSEEPEPTDLRAVGTIAGIRQMARAPNGVIQVIVEGTLRAKAEAISRDGASLKATVSPAMEQIERSIEIDAYIRRLQELIDRALSLSSGLSQELRNLVLGIEDPLRLTYVLASLLDIKPDEKQRLLEADEAVAKLKAVADALAREVSLLELKGKIASAA